jgi:hypothetical protein
MHKVDGVDNIKDSNGELGRQEWTEARMLRDLLIAN